MPGTIPAGVGMLRSAQHDTSKVLKSLFYPPIINYLVITLMP